MIGARPPRLTATSYARELVVATDATLDGGSQTLDIYGHWNKLGSFTYNESTIHFRGSHHQNISGLGSTTFYNLDVDNLAGGATHDDAVVINLLTLNSDLTTQSNRLEMGTNAISLGTGDVVGTVRRTDLGATARSFGNPYVSIAISSGTAPNPMDVTLTKGNPPFSGAVKRKYTLTPTGGSSYSATLRLHYLDGELNNNTEANLQFWRYDTGNHRWAQQLRSGSVDITNNWLEKDGVNSLDSNWAISEKGDPTAVTLVRFQVFSNSTGASIVWETASEANVLGYNLYRSLAMEDLYSRLNGYLVWAKGLGGLIGAVYTWEDAYLQPGVTYCYKLEEIGAEGSRDLDIITFTAPYQIYLAVVTNH
jgi:hypothetical protein